MQAWALCNPDTLGSEEPVREFSGKQWQMHAFQSTKVHFCDTNRAKCLVFQKLTLEILVC